MQHSQQKQYKQLSSADTDNLCRCASYFLTVVYPACLYSDVSICGSAEGMHKQGAHGHENGALHDEAQQGVVGLAACTPLGQASHDEGYVRYNVGAQPKVSAAHHSDQHPAHSAAHMATSQLSVAAPRWDTTENLQQRQVCSPQARYSSSTLQHIQPMAS